jgi:PAS domain S-box-containing protein
MTRLEKRPHEERLPTRGKEQRELVGLCLALVILAAVAALAYRSVTRAAGTLDAVEHTGIVLRQLEDLASASSRATAARRAYSVAGDSSQLPAVPELDARLARSVALVRDSIADNPDQVRRLESLAQLTAQRLAALDEAVEHRRREGTVAETADGLALAARIRGVREDMEAEENRLLAERDAQTRRDIARTKLAEVVGTVASFAILLFVFRRLRQAIEGRRRSELALRASEGFLHSIVENIPDVLVLKGADDLRFEWINKAAERLFGIDRKDVVGKTDFDLFPDDQAVFHQARDRQTLASGVVLDIPEEPLETRAGERWIHTKKVRLLDENGVPTHVLGIAEDITARRHADAALKAAKDAADALNQELESFSAKRMGDLIDGLLSLSRVTRGDMTREYVDLAALARTVVDELVAAEPERRVKVVIQDSLEGDIDRRLARALLENLIGNSWKFTRSAQNACIELGTIERDGSAAFFVRDNGAGFDMAYANQLFAPFRRLHTAAEFPGTGIGLATVQRIVRRNGGRIWAEAGVDLGATFYFTIPAEAPGATT